MCDNRAVPHSVICSRFSPLDQKLFCQSVALPPYVSICWFVFFPSRIRLNIFTDLVSISSLVGERASGPSNFAVDVNEWAGAGSF